MICPRFTLARCDIRVGQSKLDIRKIVSESCSGKTSNIFNYESTRLKLANHLSSSWKHVTGIFSRHSFATQRKRLAGGTSTYKVHSGRHPTPINITHIAFTNLHLSKSLFRIVGSIVGTQCLA